MRCSFCSLVYVNPQPTGEELSSLYNEELSHRERRFLWDASKKKYILNEKSADAAADEQSTDASHLTPAQARRVLPRISVIRKLAPPPAKVLDIGSREGDFLFHIQKNGYAVQGIEISTDYAAFASKRTGADVFSGTLDEYVALKKRDQQFDVVTMWDVIEHLPDPAAALKLIHGIQPVNGILGISTVNLANYRYLRHGPKWRGFFESQEHIFFFEAGTLSSLMKKCGYRPVKVITRMIPPFFLRWLNLFRLGHSLEIYGKRMGS